MAQLVKNLPELRETRVWSLGWEDPLEKGKATHSSILAWRSPWVTKSRTWLNDFHFSRINNEVNIYILMGNMSRKKRRTLLWFWQLQISISTFVVVQSLGHVWPFETPWTAAHRASLSFTISWSLLKLTSNKSVMICNHLILCHSLLLLPPIFPSIRVFSSESALHVRGPKYWSFSFSISPSIEYSGLISFRIHWFDLLVVQGTLKSLLQHPKLKAYVL